MFKHQTSMRTVMPAPPAPPAATPQPSNTDPPAASKKKPKKPKAPRKTAIPSAMKEQIWLRDCGEVFETKCKVPWCQNCMNVWTFQAGHNIPESKGGKTIPENLVPICIRCNLSMGNRYTLDEWNSLGSLKSIVPEAPVAPVSKGGVWSLCRCA